MRHYNRGQACKETTGQQQHLLPNLGVTAHETLLLLIQGAMLVENSPGDTHFANVVQQGRKTDLEDLLVCKVQLIG